MNNYEVVYKMISDFPKVRTSELKDEDFNPHKIADSLVRETQLDEKRAWEIALEVIRFFSQIYKMIDLLTAPMIREVVSWLLVKNGLIEYRKRYTRIGYPPYNFRELLEKIKKIKKNLIFFEIEKRIVLENIKNEVFDHLNIELEELEKL